MAITSIRFNVLGILICFILVVGLVKANLDVDSNLNKNKEGEITKFEVFRPTREWQEVKKGQPIPKGLHVRVNFETGITEAKLLDKDESKNTAVLAVEESTSDEPNSDINLENLSRDYLLDALRNIRPDDKEESPVQKDGEVFENARKNKFRTYEELKKELDDIHLLVKTDMELMNELMKSFVTSSNERRVTILIDLEDLVHQFDNAREFARLEGFVDIVYPSFNSTDTDVRSEAVKLLGSAVQSNPQVQILALSSGSIQMLLRMLLLDKSLTVRSRALYALSCLTRNFPLAQTKMLTEGGLTVLAEVYDNKENVPLQIKVVTLLSDLLQERQLSKEVLQEASQPSKEMKLKHKQYEASDLESKLVEADWCRRVPTLLHPEVTKPDNDVVEKVSNAMLTMIHVCRESFNQTSVRSDLAKLETWYDKLNTSDPDEYYISLANVLKQLRLKLKSEKSEL